jgi:hypothetical protein
LDINTILNKLKKAIKTSSYDIIPTFKNRSSRRKYGLTIYDIEDILLKLEETNLIIGPTIDRDYPNEELFIFKKEIISGVIFYIKIKEKDNKIKILSLHEDEI